MMTRPPTSSDGGYPLGCIWIDSTNTNSYECLDNTIGASIWRQIGYRVTTLDITNSIIADTNFNLFSSGTGYTFAGDAAYLLASAAIFNVSREVMVYLNGVNLRKGVSAIWVSATLMKLDIPVDNGDEIVILS